MVKVNDNFRLLPGSYLFSTVAKKIAAFREKNPEAEIIRMDIGDVTRPICPAAIKAMHEAVDDLGKASTFHGYGPEQGYSFLREAIAINDYKARGCDISADEIFVSDGAKSDLGNLGDILSKDAKVALAEPAYPAYIDANAIDGRAGLYLDGQWSEIKYLNCREDKGFLPELPKERPDIIIMCYPNNPTGVAMTRSQLKEWVDYAIANNCLIIFDSAYKEYIRNSDVPHSIYEIEGAKKVAIEIRSFSKTAGFTGLRCGYTVVPFELKGKYADGSEASLNNIWNRRQCTKFNGASYVSQRAAEALFTEQGAKEVKETVDYYMENARILRDGFIKAGLDVYGGENSPYVWVKTLDGMTSWEFFDWLLENKRLTCTPGSGFGKCGEGFFRLTGFNTKENTLKSIGRLLEERQ